MQWSRLCKTHRGASVVALHDHVVFTLGGFLRRQNHTRHIGTLHVNGSGAELGVAHTLLSQRVSERDALGGVFLVQKFVVQIVVVGVVLPDNVTIGILSITHILICHSVIFPFVFARLGNVLLSDFGTKIPLIRITDFNFRGARNITIQDAAAKIKKINTMVSIHILIGIFVC
jgi:hypothetical protein